MSSLRWGQAEQDAAGARLQHLKTPSMSVHPCKFGCLHPQTSPHLMTGLSACHSLMRTPHASAIDAQSCPERPAHLTCNVCFVHAEAQERLPLGELSAVAPLLPQLEKMPFTLQQARAFTNFRSWVFRCLGSRKEAEVQKGSSSISCDKM